MLTCAVSTRSGDEQTSPAFVQIARMRTHAPLRPSFCTGALRSAMQLDSVDGAHFSSVAVSVSTMYARSLASRLLVRPAVVRRAWKRTILVPGGAANVQLALASPSGRG